MCRSVLVLTLLLCCASCQAVSISPPNHKPFDASNPGDAVIRCLTSTLNPIWKRNGDEVDITRFTFDNDRRLRVGQLVREQRQAAEGIYQCSVNGGDSNEFQLFVLPDAILIPKEQSVRVGKNATVTCPLTFGSLGDEYGITWSSIDSPMLLNSASGRSARVLMLRNVTAGGLFTCTASIRQQRVTSSVRITTYEIMLSLESRVVLENRDAQFNCTSTGYPDSNLNFTWCVDDVCREDWSGYNNVSVPAMEGNDNTFSVFRVPRAQGSRIISCRVTGPDLNEVRRTATLSVLEAVKEVRKLRNGEFEITLTSPLLISYHVELIDARGNFIANRNGQSGSTRFTITVDIGEAWPVKARLVVGNLTGELSPDSVLVQPTPTLSTATAQPTPTTPTTQPTPTTPTTPVDNDNNDNSQNHLTHLPVVCGVVVVLVVLAACITIVVALVICRLTKRNRASRKPDCEEEAPPTNTEQPSNRQEMMGLNLSRTPPPCLQVTAPTPGSTAIPPNTPIPYPGSASQQSSRRSSYSGSCCSNSAPGGHHNPCCCHAHCCAHQQHPMCQCSREHSVTSFTDSGMISRNNSAPNLQQQFNDSHRQNMNTSAVTNCRSSEV